MTVYMTEAGGAQLLRAMRGERLVFTGVEIGSGANTSAPTRATKLEQQEKRVPIDSTSIVDGLFTLICLFTNEDVVTGFRLTEYGLFTQDMDDANKEVLFAYILQPYETADYIPAGQDRPKALRISPKVVIGDAQNISAIINSSLTYVSQEEFISHTTDERNPHNVTKKQLGLDKVVNVSPDDMTFDYRNTNPNATLSNIKIERQDRLSQIISKVASFINVGINHFFNRSNPHEVNLEQIGGAAHEHTHKTADITSGILPVARGGTGVKEIEFGAVLISEGNRLKGRTGEGAFYKGTDQSSPWFGILPVDCGGTGVNSDDKYTEDLMQRIVNEGVPIVVSGSYTGNGNKSTGVTLEFEHTPKMIMITISNSSNMNYAEDGAFIFAVKGTTKLPNVTFEWGSNTVKLIGSSDSVETKLCFNSSGVKYNYLVIC